MHCPSLRSVRLGPALRWWLVAPLWRLVAPPWRLVAPLWQLEQGDLLVRRLPPCSRRSAFPPATAPYRAVPVTAESEGAMVLASRSPHTLETTRLRRCSHSQSIQRRIVDSPSTGRCPIA